MTWLLIVFLSLALLVFAIATFRAPAPSENLLFGQEVDLTAAQNLGEASGRKTAVLFGLNYEGTSCALRGCEEDARNMNEVLLASGFQTQCFTNSESCTKQSIMSKIAALLMGLKSGDAAVIWFSGHGLFDSKSGQNGWVPSDWSTEGYLLEEWLIGHLRQLPEGVNLWIGSDACMSGSSFNLKYDLEAPRSKGQRNLKSLAYLDPTLRKSSDRQAPRLLKSLSEDWKEVTMSLFDVFPTAEPMKANIVVLAGCTDWGTSADGFEDGEYQGAMTWAFLSVLNQFKGSASVAAVLEGSRTLLKQEGYSQVPQISVSRVFSPESKLSAWGF